MPDGQLIIGTRTTYASGVSHIPIHLEHGLLCYRSNGAKFSSHVGADKKGPSSRLTAAFNATAFNIGISAATFAASGAVATKKGVLTLPFAAALAVIASLPLLSSSPAELFSMLALNDALLT